MSEHTTSRWLGATVLVTGGTGWLGQHLVDHLLLEEGVHSVRVYSRDEHKQHTMRQRWPDTGPAARVTYIVGDVRDRDRLRRACDGVNILVHAAALKRVEGSATHARELFKTNVGGTANVVDAALDNRVAWTLFVSSDKAALATNCYGKSKALAEDLVIEGNAMAGGRPVRLACVRYGNVLGSTGSVLHLWRAAAELGEPIPLTDLDMTRFWIPVGDAVDWILHAVNRMRGGEILVPKMARGRVADLARVLYPDTAFALVGERPGGEKLHETLIGEDELRHTHQLPDGYVILPQQPSWDRTYFYDGEPVPAGTPLRSDLDPRAGPDQLRALLRAAGWLHAAR